MNMKKAALAALLLSSAAACDRGTPVESSQPATAPEPPPAATAPAKPEVDYPGSIDIFTRVGAGKGTPVALVADQKVSGSHIMDRDGTLVAFGVRIGTYHGTADGSLRLSLCVDADCREAEKPVANAKDNDYLVFELPEPMTVSSGSVLRYEFARAGDAKRRVAVWSYPKLDTQSGIVDPSGEEVPMVPRLSIHLQ